MKSTRRDRLRFIKAGMVFFILLVSVSLLDPEQQAIGWLVTSILAILKGALSSAVYYGLLKLFLYVSSHEVPDGMKLHWNMTLMVSVAIVFGLTAGV